MSSSASCGGSIPSSDIAGPPRGRDIGLDAFRGLTVLLMILVNVPGDGDAAFWLLSHAAWNGLTLADLVFPWFLLIVGLSVPLAMDGRGVALTSVTRRVAVLFVVGVILGWLIRPTFDPDAVRWVGVLQRIAIVYLVCALVTRRSMGAVVPAVLAALCLLAHAALLLLVPAPGEVLPSLAPGEGMSGYLDRALLPGRLHRGTWDPEGALSTLPSIGTGLIGVAIARWRAGGAGEAAVLAAGLAMLVAGLTMTPLLPLNKNLWTASYALVAAGAGLLVWLLLARIARNARGALALPVFAGRTALTLYVVHMLLVALLVRTVTDGTIWSVTFDAIERAGLPAALASLAFSLLAVALSLAPLPWLRRRGWLLRA